MNAPERLQTERLLLRRPVASDAEAIYRYAADPEVTRYVGWPRHRSIADTRAFLAISDAEWERWGTGPFVISLGAQDAVIGSTGLAVETPHRAMTGYVLARDAWGHGYATEALGGIVALAPSLGIRRLYALCHVSHRPSAHVLEKCGFHREAILRSHSEFPNLAPGAPVDVLCYVRIF